MHECMHFVPSAFQSIFSVKDKFSYASAELAVAQLCIEHFRGVAWAELLGLWTAAQLAVAALYIELSERSDQF